MLTDSLVCEALQNEAKKGSMSSGETGALGRTGPIHGLKQGGEVF